MSRVEIWENEIDRLQKRLQELEGFERPRVGTDMTEERIRRIAEKIQRYRVMIAAEDEVDG